jgi:hypothetical protein
MVSQSDLLPITTPISGLEDWELIVFNYSRERVKLEARKSR